MKVKFENNSREFMEGMKKAKKQILFEWGELLVDAWKKEIDAKHVIDTGRFKNSTDHAEEDDSTIVGTPIDNPPYPIFLELGTSKMKARPTLKPAVTGSTDKLKQVAESIVKGK